MKRIVVLILILGVVSMGCTQKNSITNTNTQSSFQNLNIKNLIKKVRQTYNNTETVKGVEDIIIHFKNSTTSKNFEDEVEFVTKKPNKVWIYDKVHKAYYISNGTYSWIYDKENNTVTIGKVNSNKHVDDYGKYVNLIGSKNVNVSYAGNRSFNGENCYIIKISPKNINMNSYGYVYVNKNYKLTGFQLFVLSPSFTYNITVYFKNMSFNTSVNDKLFNFTIPKGARVRKVIEQIKLEKYRSVKDAQEHVHFKILVPKYTAGFNLTSIYSFGGMLILKYDKGEDELLIKEVPMPIISNTSKTEKVNIGGITGYYWTKTNRSYVAFMVGNVTVSISAPLNKTEVLEIATSMVR